MGWVTNSTLRMALHSGLDMPIATISLVSPPLQCPPVGFQWPWAIPYRLSSMSEQRVAERGRRAPLCRWVGGRSLVGGWRRPLCQLCLVRRQSGTRHRSRSGQSAGSRRVGISTTVTASRQSSVGSQSSLVCRQESVVSHQSSVVSRQSSVVSQSSVVCGQELADSHQSSVVSRQPSVVCGQELADSRQSSAISRQSSVMPPQTSGRHDPPTSEMTRLTEPPPQQKSPADPDPVVKTATQPPADGGFRAWLVVLVSFLCNGVIFGIINCYGVLYVAFLEQMESAGVANAAFKCCEYVSPTEGVHWQHVLLTPGQCCCG